MPAPPRSCRRHVRERRCAPADRRRDTVRRKTARWHRTRSVHPETSNRPCSSRSFRAIRFAPARRTAGNRYRCRPAHRPASPSAAAAPTPRCVCRENHSAPPARPLRCPSQRRRCRHRDKARSSSPHIRAAPSPSDGPMFLPCRRRKDWRPPRAPAARPEPRARRRRPRVRRGSMNGTRPADYN